MRKEDQTDEVKVELYNLTRQFVYKYQPRYFKQMDPRVTYIEDLISEFYTEFLTPKSRVKGKEQSLLDKYDPDVTCLPYLVKIAVQRKLIDYSRQHKPGYTSSLDASKDEWGDVVLASLNLTSLQEDFEAIEDREFKMSEIEAAKVFFDKLSEDYQAHIYRMFRNVEKDLLPGYKRFFTKVFTNLIEKSTPIKVFIVNLISPQGELLPSPAQQLTKQTLVAMTDGSLVGYDRHTGLSRIKSCKYKLQLESIAQYEGKIIYPL